MRYSRIPAATNKCLAALVTRLGWQIVSLMIDLPYDHVKRHHLMYFSIPFALSVYKQGYFEGSALFHPCNQYYYKLFHEKALFGFLKNWHHLSCC